SVTLLAAPGILAGLLVFMVLLTHGDAAAAPPKPHGPSTPDRTLANQIIPGFPLSMTVEDRTSIQIRYRDYGDQFYGSDAEGVYLWAKVGATTKVFGPGEVPAGRPTNPYTPVSNVLTGAGTPQNPWVVTTVNLVPTTNLRLTQQASYVNGAEFVSLAFTVEQIAGTVPITVTLFHAADLYTAASDLGYGYYDSSSGGVGDYFTPTVGSLAGSRLYQQFVPNTAYPAPSAYQEDSYGTIWANIGDTLGPGSGFTNTIISDTLHDS